MRDDVPCPSPIPVDFKVPWQGADRSATPILVRRATRRDAPRLVDLVSTLVAETTFMLQSPHDTLPTVAEQRLMVEHLNRQTNCLFVVAVRPGWTPGRGKILGTLTCLGGRGQRTHHAAQISMGVRKEMWGLGIGGMLLDAAIHWARAEASVARLGLQVYVANGSARRLYERRGFVSEGLLLGEACHEEDGVHDLLGMGLDVRHTQPWEVTANAP